LGPRGMRMVSEGGLTLEELHSLYLSYKVARLIQSRRLRWAVLEARMECFKALTQIYRKSNNGLKDGILERNMCQHEELDGFGSG
jgi:hypothetical protein